MNRRIRVAAVLLSLVSSATPAVLAEEVGDPLDEPARVRAESYFHLMNAVWLAGQGRQHAAGVELGKALDIEPDSADLRAEAAVFLMTLGRQADAERQARKALALDPENLRGLRLLAAIVEERSSSGLRGSGGLFEAVTLYERLVRGPEARPEDFSSLIRLRLRLGDQDGAVHAARALVERRPGNAAAVRQLVRVLVHLQRGPEALEELLGFLTARPGLGAGSPDLEDASDLVSELTRGQGLWDVFEERAGEVLEAQPDAGALFALYGEALLRKGRTRDAMPMLERAMELSRDDPLLTLHVATVYAGIGRLGDSAELTRALAADFPDHPGVQGLLGEVLSRQGIDDEAVEALRAAWLALQDDPAEAARRDSMLLRIGWIELGRDEYAGARNALDALENPRTQEALELECRLALAEGDLRAARGVARSLGETGNSIAAQLLEGEIWAADGQPERAIAAFERAETELGPGVRGRAAEVLHRYGFRERGERVLREWVRARPEDADARFRLGAYLDREERHAESERQLREAIRLDGEFPEALNHLAYSLAVQGRKLGEALEMVREALRIDPWNGAYLDSLGWVYYQMGRYQEALEPLERAARELPRDPTVLEHLGDCYHSLGDAERALAIWNRALENNPDRAEKLRAKIALHGPDSGRK